MSKEHKEEITEKTDDIDRDNDIISKFGDVLGYLIGDSEKEKEDIKSTIDKFSNLNDAMEKNKKECKGKPVGESIKISLTNIFDSVVDDEEQKKKINNEFEGFFKMCNELNDIFGGSQEKEDIVEKEEEKIEKKDILKEEEKKCSETDSDDVLEDAVSIFKDVFPKIQKLIRGDDFEEGEETFSEYIEKIIQEIDDPEDIVKDPEEKTTKKEKKDVTGNTIKFKLWTPETKKDEDEDIKKSIKSIEEKLDNMEITMNIILSKLSK
jgi:hypothetical protein